MSAESESLRQLLHSWGTCGNVIDAFDDQELTLGSLELLSEEDIKLLIPKAGPRLLFLKKWEAWKSLCNHHLSPKRRRVAELNEFEIEEPEVDPQPEPQPEPEPETVHSLLQCPPINDLHSFLRSSVSGQIILGYYDKNGQMCPEIRDQLAERALHFILKDDLNKKISRDQFQSLAESIVELFPKEVVETYFLITVKKKRTFVEGKLRYKFYSIRRQLLKCGLIHKSTVIQEQDLDHSDSDTPDVEYDENLLWLKSNEDPWPEVVEKWKATFNVRKNIRNRCKSVYDYISQFPALQLCHGWELLVLDVDEERPHLLLADLQWSTFITNIETLIKKVDSSFKIPDNVDDDFRLVLVLNNLASIFKVYTLPKSPIAKKGDPCWRPSRVEVQEGFILVVKGIAAIREKLDARRKRLTQYSWNLQPVPVILTNGDKVKQCFLCLDSYRWECPSPKEAFVAMFKIFFALDAQYPPEARHIWLYVQRNLFQLETPQDYKDSRGLKSYLAAYLNEYKSLN